MSNINSGASDFQTNEVVPLSVEVLQKGLKNIGFHPLFLRHAFLELDVCNVSINSIDIVCEYTNLMYLNLSKNKIQNLSALQHLATLVKLDARSIFIKYAFCNLRVLNFII
jgi:hypothetical protein